MPPSGTRRPPPAVPLHPDGHRRRGAMAAGVAEAMSPAADVFSVVRAALHCARKGEDLGRKWDGPFHCRPSTNRPSWRILALRAENRKAANRCLRTLSAPGFPHTN